MKDGDQDLDLDIEKDDTYNDYGDSKYHPFVYPLTNLLLISSDESVVQFYFEE